MKIEHRINGNTCVVDIEGEMSLHVMEIFTSSIKSIIENDDIKHVTLNFEKVEYIDSSGIGHIAATFKALKQRGAKLGIYNISEKSWAIFEINQLDQVMSLQKKI